MSEETGEDIEDRPRWFWRIPERRREALLAAVGLVLVVWPIFQFNWVSDQCGHWHWIIPASGFFGGALIFGYSGLLSVRGIGCLAMFFSPFVVLALSFCLEFP